MSGEISADMDVEGNVFTGTDQSSGQNQSVIEVAEILSTMAQEIDVDVAAIDAVNVSNVDRNELTYESVSSLIRSISVSSARDLASTAINLQKDLIKKVSSVMIMGAREYIDALKDTTQITMDVIKQDALIGASTVYDMVLKGIASVEGASSAVGFTKPVDDLIKQHEDVIYMLLQKESMEILGDDYISPSMSNDEVKAFLDTMLTDNRFAELHNSINAHIIRAAQLFFFNKMGESAVSSMEIMNIDIQDDAMGTPPVTNNEELIEKYNIEQLRKRIVALTSSQELKYFLTNVILDTHNKNYHNHTKYFGMPYEIDAFIEHLVGDEGFLTAELDHHINSVSNSVDYYIDNILGKLKKRDGSVSSGESITPPNGVLFKRVDALPEKIMENMDELYDYVDQQYKNNFKDFKSGSSSEINMDKNTKLHQLRTTIDMKKDAFNLRVEDMKTKMSNAVSMHKGAENIDGGSKRRKTKRTRSNKKKKGKKSKHTKRKKGGRKSKKHKPSRKKTSRKKHHKRTMRKRH